MTQLMGKAIIVIYRSSNNKVPRVLMSLAMLTKNTVRVNRIKNRDHTSKRTIYLLKRGPTIREQSSVPKEKVSSTRPKGTEMAKWIKRQEKQIEKHDEVALNSVINRLLGIKWASRGKYVELEKQQINVEITVCSLKKLDFEDRNHREERQHQVKKNTFGHNPHTTPPDQVWAVYRLTSPVMQ